MAPDSETAALERWESTFAVIRGALSRRARIAQLPGLATGNAVPDDVDVIFMVRPGALHEREVYAIDQFVQRGGRLVVCLDDPDYNLAYPRADVAPEDFEGSPLAELLGSWGIQVAAKHVWDDAWKTDRITLTAVGGQLRKGVISDPLVITVPPEGLATDLPPTGGSRASRSPGAPAVPRGARAPRPRRPARRPRMVLQGPTSPTWRLGSPPTRGAPQPEGGPAQRTRGAAHPRRGLRRAVPSPWAGKARPGPPRPRPGRGRAGALSR